MKGFLVPGPLQQVKGVVIGGKLKKASKHTAGTGSRAGLGAKQTPIN